MEELLDLVLTSLFHAVAVAPALSEMVQLERAGTWRGFPTFTRR